MNEVMWVPWRPLLEKWRQADRPRGTDKKNARGVNNGANGIDWELHKPDQSRCPEDQQIIQRSMLKCIDVYEKGDFLPCNIAPESNKVEIGGI